MEYINFIIIFYYGKLNISLLIVINIKLYNLIFDFTNEYVINL